MGIASVHYLSMNVRDGRITPTGAYTEQVAQTITPSGLQASTPYTIHWGDTTTTTFTSDASGTTTAKSHTYNTGGTFTVTITRDDTGQIAASYPVTVAWNDGTIASDGTVTHNTVETFTLASLANSNAFDIDWGDGTAHSPFTSSGAGGGTATHNYATAGAKTINVYPATDVGGHVVATLTFTAV